MARITISLSDARYRTLKEAAAQRDKTMGQLIDESLEFFGLKSREDAQSLVRTAREHSNARGSILSDDDAMALATTQVRQYRRKGK